MRLCFTPEAQSRLRSIHRYIAEDSPAHALALVERLIQRAEAIPDAPRAGRMVSEYRQQNLREVLVRPYRIIYRLQPDTIEIITILHYRQLLPDDLAPSQ